MVILGALTIIGFFLEEAEVGPGLGLGPFFVGYAFYGVAEG